MKVVNSKLPGVMIITPNIFKDVRGYFFESYRKSWFKENGIPYDFVQDNEVKSKKGVLRGLHYQLNQPQGKLIRVNSGSILDVVVDIRKGSPYFGQSEVVELDSNDCKMLYVPEGFAHGYLVTSDVAFVTYKCTKEYSPSDQYGIMWSDPFLDLNWGIDNPILSKMDQKWPILQQQINLPVYS